MHGPEIKVLTLDGQQTSAITVVGTLLQSLSWTRDHKNLYVTSGSETGFELLRVNLDGKFTSLSKVPMSGGWILNPGSFT
jgi:hypothetical protein